MSLLSRILSNSSFKFIFELVFVILPIAFLIRTFGFGLYQVPTGSMETTLLVGERFFADKLSYWFKQPEYEEIIAFDDPRYPYSQNLILNTWQRYVSWNVTNWTKRVIGKPKDHLVGKIENGHPVVYRNGEKLTEPYINKYPIIAVWKADPRLYLSGKLKHLDYTYKSFDPAEPFDKQKFYKINSDLIVKGATGQPEILWPGIPHPEKLDEFDVVLNDKQYWVMGDNRLGSYDSRAWGPLEANLIHGKIVYRIWSMDSDESWWFIDLLKHPIEFWKKIRWNRCFQTVN